MISKPNLCNMKQGWEIKKLGEVCEINYGTRVVQKKDGGMIYPVYGGGGATFRIDRFNRQDCLIVSRFAMSNQCVRFVKGKFFLNDSGLSLKTKESTIWQPYLDKHIIAYNDKIYSLGKGAAQRNLDINAFKSINISYPLSLPEQERIVAELDCLSGVIEKKKQQLKELDALAQSIFYEMFGDPITNEKGWGKDMLNNIAEITSSKRIFADEYCKSGIPFYRGKEISEKSKGNPISIELFISYKRYNELQVNYGVPTVGDILITAVGTIGNIWVVDSDEPFYFKDGNIIWLKIKNNTNPLYLKFLLSLLIDEYKEQIANGCAYSALTIVNLKAMQTPLPPLSLQQAFASKIEAIDKQKELIKQSIKEVETLFNSRMDYYFN